MKEKNGATINMAVVGAKGSGKSALTVRFLTRRFIGEYDSQADVCIDREIEIAGKATDVHIKDTAGCVWLKGPSALIGWSSAIVIVYSVTDTRSFDLVTYILKNLKVGNRLDPNCVLLLGNKKDLDHLRRVPYAKGKRLARDYGIHFQEISAATDYDGVDSAFRKLLFHALSLQVSKLSEQNDILESNNNKHRKSSLVVRDHPERRSLRRLARRTSTGSHDCCFRDSLSSTSTASFNSLMSEEEKMYVSLQAQINASNSPIAASPIASRDGSPTSIGKRRKISLPVLFEKLGRHYNNGQKYMFLKIR